nr:basic proline-rich protein [Oryctolagus cuniculus]XP_051688236.1 basic proline-rich protein [Oryctolagus cuniculus]
MGWEGNSLQKSRRLPGGPSPAAQLAPGDPLQRAPHPPRTPSGAALPAVGEAGAPGEGRPRPRTAARPRRLAPARRGPDRCPTSRRVRPPAPCPSARRSGWDGPGRPRRGRAPPGAPALSHSLTVSAAPAPGRDGAGTAQCRPPFAEGVPPALSPPSHAAVLRQRKAAPLAPLRVPDRSRSTSAAEPALGAAGAPTVGVVFPAVTALPQPRSSLPLRVAPAFCFTRGTTNAAAAMLTTEPGGGAQGRRAECGCASPADGAPGRRGPRAPAPRPPRVSPRGASPRGAPARGVPAPSRRSRSAHLAPDSRLRLPLSRGPAAPGSEPHSGNV